MEITKRKKSSVRQNFVQPVLHVNRLDGILNGSRKKPRTVSMEKKDYSIYFLVILALTVLAYVGLHTCFNIYYEDDSWTMSNSYNLVNLGVDHDLLFLDQDGAFTGQLFGKLYFTLNGYFLNVVGWSKAHIFLFNSVLIFGVACTWYNILGRLPIISSSISKFVPLVIPLFPPCFFAAHTGRTDAFTLLLMSVGFLFFIRKNYVLAGFIGVLAIESHIMGVVGLFYYLSYFLYNQIYVVPRLTPSAARWGIVNNIIWKTTAGAAAGLVVYAALHYEVFDPNYLYHTISSKTDMVSPVNNYILSYFTDFDWYYHIPEFILLIGTTIIYCRQKLYRDNPFLFILMIVLLCSTFITRRENRNYFIYITPALLIFYFHTYLSIGKLKTFITGLLLILAGYYTTIYVAHNHYKFSEFVSFVKRHATQGDLPIVGMPDVWFAAMDHTFFPIHNERDFNKIELREFYLVETDYLAHRSRVYDQVKSNIYLNNDCRTIADWDTDGGHKAAVCHCKANGKEKVSIEYQPYPGWKKVVRNFIPASIFSK